MKRKSKVKSQKSKLVILVLFLCLLLLPAAFFLQPTLAQSSTCTTTGTAILNGLASTPVLSTSLANSSLINNLPTCVIDSKSVFVSYKIPTYADLKSLYFDQSKATKDSTTLRSTDITSLTSFSGDKVWYDDTGDLTVSGSPTGSGTQVIFVSGNLNITADYKYASTNAQAGTVFVVNGDVNITQTVSEVDAVIIAGGTIYTADAGCNSSSKVTTTKALTINGSLVALTDTTTPPTPLPSTPPIYTYKPPIQFCRSLSINTTAAEIVNYQPKYLVILRNLMSQTFQKWSETYE